MGFSRGVIKHLLYAHPFWTILVCRYSLLKADTLSSLEISHYIVCKYARMSNSIV